MKLLILILAIIISYQLYSQKKYELPCKYKLLMVSKEILLSQVGVTEKTGKNNGIEIEKYLKCVGLSSGNPYCAAGQYWCFVEACSRLKLSAKQIPITKTGLANKMYNDAALNGKRAKYYPAVHDLMVWRNGSSSFGHIERIISVSKAGWVTTVGFNTSCRNVVTGKNVQGVFIKNRNIIHPLGKMAIRGLIGFRNK